MKGFLSSSIIPNIQRVTIFEHLFTTEKETAYQLQMLFSSIEAEFAVGSLDRIFQNNDPAFFPAAHLSFQPAAKIYLLRSVKLCAETAQPLEEIAFAKDKRTRSPLQTAADAAPEMKREGRHGIQRFHPYQSAAAHGVLRHQTL